MAKSRDGRRAAVSGSSVARRLVQRVQRSVKLERVRCRSLTPRELSCRGLDSATKAHLTRLLESACTAR